jgi:hypothetical protein
MVAVSGEHTLLSGSADAHAASKHCWLDPQPGCSPALGMGRQRCAMEWALAPLAGGGATFYSDAG